MSKAKCSEAEFVELLRTLGPTGTGRKLGISTRTVFLRRNTIEAKTGEKIIVADARVARAAEASIVSYQEQYIGRLDLEIETGCVIIGSDCHFWPNVITPAFRAYIKLIKEMKPRAVVLNGDVLDGASISRHPPIGWEHHPTLVQEIETCQDRLHEIEMAAGKVRKIWTLGNHDSRLSTRLATVAPEYAKVKGVSLNDHFPNWESAWTCFVNNDVVIKHRHKGGIHSTHNSTMWAGKTTVCGHLHSLKVTPFSDYGGVRYGVDTGTMADIYGPQFSGYTEGNPVNWRSGFVILTFHRGRLLWPEIVHVIGENEVEFRGRVIEV